MATKVEIVGIIKMLCDCYPGKVIPAQTVDQYVTVLERVPTEYLNEAAGLCRLECQYFPTIPDIYQRAVHLYALEQGMTDGWARSILENTGWFSERFRALSAGQVYLPGMEG